jgi:Dna[CI] antecedent, DciA
MDDFFSFAELVPKALVKYKIEREARAALVCQRFRTLMPTVLGEDAPAAVKPKFVKGGTLYVAVPSSVWAQRVYVHRHELLVQLNLNMAENSGVDDIRTQVENELFA